MTNATAPNEAGQPLAYFDIQLSGYADGDETDDDLSLWVSAADESEIREFVPKDAGIVRLSLVPDPINVLFRLPADGHALRAAVARLLVKDVPRDDIANALENLLASMESVMAHLGDKMTAGDRAGRELAIAEGHAALVKHLAMRNRIAAHDNTLNAEDTAPTGDDYNAVLAELGIGE